MRAPTIASPERVRMLTDFCQRLEFSQREVVILFRALHARTLVETGRYLCAPYYVAAAQRLIARGFLTKSSEQPDPSEGIVVLLDRGNWEYLRYAARDRPLPAKPKVWREVA